MLSQTQPEQDKSALQGMGKTLAGLSLRPVRVKGVILSSTPIDLGSQKSPVVRNMAPLSLKYTLGHHESHLF